MKRTIRIICVLLFVLSFVVIAYPTGGHAGTFMIGAKSWFAVWDSAIDQELIDLAGQDIEDDLETNYGVGNAEVDSSPEKGFGFIAGPLLGYQSNDGLWSFSGAIMLLNSFSQETDGTVVADGTEYDGEYELELNRSEIDLAVTRSITNNFKVFAGYKHLILENKFSGEIKNAPITYKGDIYKVDITMQIPTIGIGYVYPFTDKMIFGLQLGVLYAMTDVEYKNYIWDESGDVDVENSPGYTAEANLSFLASDQFLLQGGFRYQAIKFKTESGEVADIDAWDQFYGITISAVYIIQ